ncbi:unnamed protein product [Cylindrotheca closterium]|uniref:Uncharacterized protein n=1 Tax=Cylindrotheca closterium TaxID=2856 RepID=A0AAD2D0Z2_9STRA|nr:unnamed protein product [Cylindrotheca closterium]
MGEPSEKEKRTKMIEKEFDQIIDEADKFCLEFLEEDMDPEAVNALRKAANKLAYVKKYYDVMKDEIVFFPSVGKLILKGDLTEEAENDYYEEEDEWPLEYTKALKTVVRSAAKTEEETEVDGENDAYMEKLATDVEI